jgi:hypothetical protein
MSGAEALTPYDPLRRTGRGTGLCENVWRKGPKHDSIRGINSKGKHDKNELSTRGWQRSGALVRFFNPMNGKFAHPALGKPDVIFAENPSGHVKTERALNTVRALADSLKLKIDPSTSGQRFLHA